MNAVIGVSFTAEYLLKGLYENTFGGLTEWIEGRHPTELDTAEDHFNRDWNAEYVAFIRLRPWYEFSFATRLKKLWSLPPFPGASVIRRWERRFALSAEFIGKSLWGWVIEKGAKGTYGPDDERITLWVVGPPSNGWKTIDGIRMVQSLGDTHYLISIPRYEPFTALLPKLTAAGLQIQEIAGNRNLMATWIVPDAVTDLPGQLTQWKILTAPGKKRVAVLLVVDKLASSFVENPKAGAVLDHLFDY